MGPGALSWSWFLSCCVSAALIRLALQCLVSSDYCRASGGRAVATALRTTGIDVVGPRPWGTHFCYFYETTDDLLDTLVPYFLAGLESGELCVWVIADPLTEADARRALGHTVPASGDIGILPARECHLEDTAVHPNTGMGCWHDRLAAA